MVQLWFIVLLVDWLIMSKVPFKLLGLTPQHKDFLQNYAQEKLGSSSRTKAILYLIEQAMADYKNTNSSSHINDELRKKAIDQRKKFILNHQEKLKNRETEINQARLANNQNLLKQIYKNRLLVKQKRIQLSLPIYDYEFLEKLALDSDSSIQHYIKVILYDYLYSDRKLLGIEIEALKKSNYELYKIGVNVNQIAKANNAGDKVNLPINKLYNFLQSHINIVKNILNNTTDIY